MIHEKAAQGFQRAGDEYQKGRPEYSKEVIDFLVEKFNLTPDTQILDLAAGTGKMTKLLVDRKLSVSAVEPVQGMREQFEKILPQTPLAEGRAEKIPCPDDCVDVIIVAQAFHWFANAQALKECSRVLKPGGFLVLVWNVRDDRIPWVQSFNNIIDPYRGTTPQYHTGEWRQVFTKENPFQELQETELSYTQNGDVAMLENRATSTSFISTLSEEERHSVVEKIRALATATPELSDGNVSLPHRTHIYWAQVKKDLTDSP